MTHVAFEIRPIQGALLQLVREASDAVSVLWHRMQSWQREVRLPNFGSDKLQDRISHCSGAVTAPVLVSGTQPCSGFRHLAGCETPSQTANIGSQPDWAPFANRSVNPRLLHTVLYTHATHQQHTRYKHTLHHPTNLKRRGILMRLVFDSLIPAHVAFCLARHLLPPAR